MQCLVRLEALEGFAEPALRDAPRCSTRTASSPPATASARSSSTRPATAACPPPAGWPTLVDACRPHARALGCERELALLAGLAGDPGAARQRAIAAERAGLPGLLHALEADFSPPRPRLAAAA